MPIDRKNLILQEIVEDEKPLEDKPSIKSPQIKRENLVPYYKPMKYTDEMIGTLKNFGKVYPAFETAGNIATSSYGIPISGLVGLAALPFGLDAANSAVEAVKKFLVYEPKTPILSVQGGVRLSLWQQGSRVT